MIFAFFKRNDFNEIDFNSFYFYNSLIMSVLADKTISENIFFAMYFIFDNIGKKRLKSFPSHFARLLTLLG
jgi:hypothetical protein